MGSIDQAEKTIGGLFKGAPAMPEKGKETLVKVWPWIALVVGILQLLAAWGVWELTHVANVLNNFANSLNVYGANVNTGLSAGDKLAIYLGVIVLVVDAVLLLLAFPKLKIRVKQGWDLLFAGALLNVLYAVVAIFINGRGFGSFLFSLIGSVIGFYLLFQVKGKYTVAGIAAVAPKAKA